jgi:hypothetical protein
METIFQLSTGIIAKEQNYKKMKKKIHESLQWSLGQESSSLCPIEAGIPGLH